MNNCLWAVAGFILLLIIIPPVACNTFQGRDPMHAIGFDIWDSKTGSWSNDIAVKVNKINQPKPKQYKMPELTPTPTPIPTPNTHRLYHNFEITCDDLYFMKSITNDKGVAEWLTRETGYPTAMRTAYTFRKVCERIDKEGVDNGN